MAYYPPPSSGGTATVQEEGVTQSTTVTTFNFTGAGATASGAGATATINIPGGAGSFAITEAEIDFGSSPVTDKTFTITNASITAASKIIVTPSGNTATSRATGDALWDAISYAALPAAGSFTLYAHANGAVVGKRKIVYTFA